jgi:4-diphosphocytidyl-2-C-methyl-D-erythritol kinase
MLFSRALAKINLTLHVLSRRADGYHNLESLTAFTGLSDGLRLVPHQPLSLNVKGETALAAGRDEDNLVLKAARLLQQTVPELITGRFELTKRLPVAAGLGGGSADAAAALRLLAMLNHLPLDHPALQQAVRQTGADVPVCLERRARMMSGIGDILSPFYALPPLFAVLVNPGLHVPTQKVFQHLVLNPSPSLPPHAAFTAHKLLSTHDFIKALHQTKNDLEGPAIQLFPLIGEVLSALRRAPQCQLARMSGSGATCFGLFLNREKACQAAKTLQIEYPNGWTRTTTLR